HPTPDPHSFPTRRSSDLANGLYVPPPFVRPDPKYEHADFIARAEEISGAKMTPMQSSWFWFRQGMKFITDEPGAWIRLLGRKLIDRKSTRLNSSHEWISY